MPKSVKNTELLHPETGKVLAKETIKEGKKIVVTQTWKVFDCMIAAVSNQPVKTTEQCMRNIEIVNILKKQKDKDEIILNDADFTEVQKMCTTFTPLLEKGIMFGDFFKIIQQPTITPASEGDQADKKE